MTTRRAWLTILTLLLLPAATVAEEEARRTTRDVLRDLKGSDPVVRLNAVEEARQDQDAAVTSQLVRMIKDRDPELRLACIDALRERTEPAGKKSAALALGARLPAFSGKVIHAEEYLAVISVLHDLAQPVAIKSLMEMKVEEPQESAKARLMAVGNTPDNQAIEALIAFASKGRQRGRNNQLQFAIAALRYATGENHGSDSDRWRMWWNDVKKEWDPRRAAEKREEQREKERLKRERQEEKRRKAAERREKRKKRDDGEGVGD